jgi:hypothetical protein
MAKRMLGHTVGFRFNGYMTKPRDQIERACENLYGYHGWRQGRDWSSYFGSKNATGARTYWITLKSEADLTAILLKISVDD